MSKQQQDFDAMVAASQLPGGYRSKKRNIDSNYNNWMGQQAQKGAWGYTPTAGDYFNEPGFANFIQQYNPSFYEQMSGANIDSIPSDSVLGQGVAENFKAFMRGPKKSQAEFRPQHLIGTQPNRPYDRMGEQYATAQAAKTRLDPLYQRIEQEQSSLSGLPQPIFPGRQFTDKSPLTKRKEDLERAYAQKGTPYGPKIDKLLTRESQGFSPKNIAKFTGNAANIAGNAQNEDIDILRNTLRDPYSDSSLRGNMGKNLGRHQGLLEERLGNLGQDIANEEDALNLQQIDLLRKLSEGKKVDRNFLSTLLGHAGNQDQSIKNMGLEAGKQAFDEEAKFPYKNLELIKQALEPHRAFREAGLKSGNERNEHNKRRSLTEAGGGGDIGPYVDTNIIPAGPSPEDIQRIERLLSTHYQKYPSQRVSDMPPELQQAFDQLQGFNLKSGEVGRSERKALMNEMMNRPQGAIGDIVSGKNSSNIQRQIEELRRQHKEGVADTLNRISGEYVNLGQYNSPSHIGKAEQYATKANDELQHRINELMEREAARGFQNEKMGTQNNMKRLEQLGMQRSQNAQDQLNRISSLNQQGSERFNTKQDTLDKAYADYMTQQAWQYPQLKQHILAGSNPELLGIKNLNRNNATYIDYD